MNALRGHLAEFGLVAPAGIGGVPRLAAMVEHDRCDPPELAREVARTHIERIERLSSEIERLRAADGEGRVGRPHQRRRPVASRTTPGPTRGSLDRP